MPLFLLPVTPGVLLPVVIIDTLVRVGTVSIPDFSGQITLMDLDGHECLDLGSDECGEWILKTHLGQIIEHGSDFLDFAVEFVSAVFDASSFKSFSHFGGPDHLHSEQRDLRRRSVNEFFGRTDGALLGTDTALIADGGLHLVGEEVEPDFDLTFGTDFVVEVDVFGGTSEFLVDLDDGTAIFLIEGNHLDTSVEFFEVILDLFRVRSE